MLRKVALLMRRRPLEQGLTLMECLVAIAVIAIVSAAIAPTVLLAAATRVQNQRAEQATQLAQGEVDRIKLLLERGQYITANLPPVTNEVYMHNTAAPAAGTGGYTDIRANVTYDKGLAVDVDGNRTCITNGTCDFVVQTFRHGTQSVSVNNIDIPVAFRMGVRVYSFRAFTENSTLQRELLPLGFTSGQNSQRPLAVFYTDIARNDRDVSLCQYRELLERRDRLPADECPELR